MGIFNAIIPSGRHVQDGVPLAKGVLPQGYGALRWVNGSGQEVKCDSRPLMYWPDGSIRAVWVSSLPHAFTNTSFSLEHDSSPAAPITPFEPTVAWLKEHITAQITKPDNTGLYVWEPQIATKSHVFVGAYSQETEVWGWFRNTANQSERWTWGRVYLIQRISSPGVWEVWFHHSNMQPRGTVASDGSGGYITQGYKRGALKIRHFRIWPSSVGRTKDIDYWMHPRYYEQWPTFTQKSESDSQSPRIVPMSSYAWDDPNNPNGNSNGSYYSYYTPAPGWMEWEFLEDSASQIVRFWIKQDGTTFNWGANQHLPQPLRPQDPDSVIGYWEADGVLPHSNYANEIYGFNPYFITNLYHGDSSLGDFSDSTPPNVKYKLRRVICRHHEYINTHQPGYGRLGYYYDTPQLLNQAQVGYTTEDYFHSMILVGMSELERPIQHNWLDPDNDSITHTWEHTRTTSGLPNPYWSNDKYTEGQVGSPAASPSPDYNSINAAKQPAVGGSWFHRDFGGRQAELNGSDSEHVTCPELQAYLRTGLYWFRDRTINKADCLRDFSYYTPGGSKPFSSRVIAFGTLIHLNASKLFQDLNKAYEYYLRGAHFFTSTNGFWSFEGKWRTEGGTEATPLPVPLNDYSQYPPKVHGIDYTLKPILSYGIIDPSQMSMWMGSQAIQALSIMIRHEVDWFAAGKGAAFSVVKALGTIRDTMRVHMLKSILPGHYSPPQGTAYTGGGFYYRMPDDNHDHDFYPEPLGYDGYLVWRNDWLRNSDQTPDTGGITANAFWNSSSQWNTLGMGSVMLFGENYMTVEIIEWVRRMAPELLNALYVTGGQASNKNIYSEWHASLEQWYQKQVGCIDVPY